MQVSSDSLGSYLRAEREYRGVSLQEISAVTKIQVKFLDALEEDADDQLPPMPFVVGFLRAYAQCLSLDPDEIVVAYHQRHRMQDSPETSHPLTTPQRRHVVSLGSMAVVVGVVVLALLAVWVWRGMRPRDDVRQGVATMGMTHKQTAGSSTSISASVASTSPTPPADLQVPPAAPAPAVRAAPPPAVPVPAAPGLAARPVPQTASPAPLVPTPTEGTTSVAVLPPFVLQADAVEDTWLRVVIDDDKRYALLLKAGNNIRWQAEERFVLTVGNARGTRLQLNGHEVSLPHTGSNVVRDFLLTRGLLN